MTLSSESCPPSSLHNCATSEKTQSSSKSSSICYGWSPNRDYVWKLEGTPSAGIIVRSFDGDDLIKRDHAYHRQAYPPEVICQQKNHHWQTTYLCLL